MKTRRIGEIFDIGENTFIIKEGGDTCKGCDLEHTALCIDGIVGWCSRSTRLDGKGIIVKRLKDVKEEE